MPITTRRATEADLPAIAALSDAGFKSHPWSRAMYPVHDSAGNIARYLGRHTKAFHSGKSDFEVAVDSDATSSNTNHNTTTTTSSSSASPTNTSSGQIVGYARWEITTTQEPEATWNVPYEPYPVPEGAVAEANDVLSGQLHGMRLKHYRGAPMALLNFLVIDPAYQRRGVGGMLMRWGLQQADTLGLPAWLEATDAGYGLYARNGFEPVDVVDADMSGYGVTDRCVITIMRREPVKREGADA